MPPPPTEPSVNPNWPRTLARLVDAASRRRHITTRRGSAGPGPQGRRRCPTVMGDVSGATHRPDPRHVDPPRRMGIPGHGRRESPSDPRDVEVPDRPGCRGPPSHWAHDRVGHPGDDPAGARSRGHQPVPGLSRLRPADGHHRGGQGGHRRRRQPVHRDLGLSPAAGTPGRAVPRPAGLGRRSRCVTSGHVRGHRGPVRRALATARPGRRGARARAGARQLPTRLLPGRRRAGGRAPRPRRSARPRAARGRGHPPHPGDPAEHPPQPDRSRDHPRGARGVGRPLRAP